MCYLANVTYYFILAVDEAISQASDNPTEQGSDSQQEKPTLATQAEEYQPPPQQPVTQQPPTQQVSSHPTIRLVDNLAGKYAKNYMSATYLCILSFISSSITQYK